MPYLWDDEAWSDYLYWMEQDKKTLKKINSLLKDISGRVALELGKPSS